MGQPLTLNVRVGRVARALSLNFGCPVLRFLKGGVFVSVILTRVFELKPSLRR